MEKNKLALVSTTGVIFPIHEFQAYEVNLRRC